MGFTESSWLRACDQRLHRCVGGCLMARLASGQRFIGRAAPSSLIGAGAGRALFFSVVGAMPWSSGPLRAAKSGYPGVLVVRLNVLVSLRTLALQPCDSRHGVLPSEEVTERRIAPPDTARNV